MTDRCIETQGIRQFRVDWHCVLKNVRIGMAIVGAFAIGGWVTSIRLQEQKIPYLQRSTAKFEVIRGAVGANAVEQIRCDRKVAAAVATVLKNKQANTPVRDVLPVVVCPPPKSSGIGPK